jgi:hypothetical protein
MRVAWALAPGIAATLLGVAAAAGIAADGKKSAAPAGAARPTRPPARGTGGDDLVRLAAEVIRTTRQYRESLDKLRVIYERDIAEAHRQAEDLRGEIGAREEALFEMEQAELARETARQNLGEVLAWIAEADQLLIEATIVEEVSRLPALGVGGFLQTQMLVRYNGPARFGLEVLPRVERYFLGAFGRPMPVSARGQTSLHDRMGLDHRQAVDVALHPDSAEGRGLMAYLRRQGIPFIGLRGAMAGASTGAHIHIGQPSARLAVGRR